jgi:predicted GIY-YIG superfamily endonuclease
MIKCKYFVYLLKSTVSNHTYVGYTVDIKTRLKRHNGILSGGAKKTKKHRPWKIILYVSGFEFERTAMQYEFCIQKSKRGAGVANKIKIMKSLLKREKICSTAIPNSEMNLVIFFSSQEYYEMWKSS